MNKKILRVAAQAAVLAFAAASLFATSDGLRAEDGIKLVSTTFVTEFPDGFRVTAQFEGPSAIETIAARVRIGQQTAGSYDYLEFDTGTQVEGELFWRTNTLSTYIPPGTIITLSFEVEDVEGNELKTEPSEHVYEDPNYEWFEISEGAITVAYHGPVESRAQLVLDAMVDTVAIMGPLLGAETESPIRVTMYNNRLEMVRAQPPRSAEIARNTTTLGQAFSQEGVLLVLGNSEARGTASHEVTHILVHRAADSPGQFIPSWLNEGLAEYGNLEEGPEYEIALEFAVATGVLQSTLNMVGTPGNPDDLIIFYGQSRSIVEFMIERFGADKMTELMATMKKGIGTPEAIERVYGITQVELENLWRDKIGADPYVPPDTDQAKPTPEPRRKIGLYSLTPQPETETISAASETPTPLPERSVSEPSDTPTAAAEATEPAEPAAGSGCGAPLPGGARDASAAALLLGLVGLRFRPGRG